MMPKALLDRQIARASAPSGTLDVKALLKLVEAAYEERDLDRRRADRANWLMAEELACASAELELQNLRFKAALDNMGQGLSLFDRNGRLTVCNRRFLEIYGLPEQAGVPGTPLKAMLDGSAMLGAPDTLNRTFLVDTHLRLDTFEGGAIEQPWPDGRTIAIARKRVEDGGFLDTITDVTESRTASERISHLARHDALTGLPNRVALRERLHDVVRESRRDISYAVMCLDLDRFKAVNDTLGHPMGDALLVAASQRLSALVRESDMVVRLGGDEFAVIQRRVTAASAAKLARRIVDDLSRPYHLHDHQLRIGVSVGIVIVDGPRSDPDELLRHADLALYQAKSEGRGQYRVFEPALDVRAAQRRQVEIDIRDALEQRHFIVHYQPQVDVRTGEVCAFEALARWMHPTRGLISPIEFIPVAEETGLIDELGAHVLVTACHDAMTWSSPVSVAVNLSAVQFNSGELVALVDRALRDSRLAPSRLELEITESVMLNDKNHVFAQLRQLKALGVNVSLDDFGTGYSSFSYIRAFPFDRIKIDRSFVKELGANADSLAIVRAVTGLCGSLGISVTAEGVETASQFEFLRREKCDSVQGFLFSRPIPATEIEGLIENLASRMLAKAS